MLVENWREIVRHAWSSRLMLIASILTGLEALLLAFGATWLPGPQWLRMVIYFAVMVAAYVMRIVSQQRFRQ